MPACTLVERMIVSVDCTDPDRGMTIVGGFSSAVEGEEGGAISSAPRPPPAPPPEVTAFSMVAFRLMPPENPFRLVSVIIDVALVPIGETIVVGLTVMLKSVT